VPLYEYRCESCGDRVELIQKFSDPPLTECQRCHGKLTKVITAPALQFKGSGFYITDYTNKGKPPKDESKGGSESKEKSEKKTPAETSSPKSSDTKSSKD
jgi:putative FmdB family regulatory protein